MFFYILCTLKGIRSLIRLSAVRGDGLGDQFSQASGLLQELKRSNIYRHFSTPVSHFVHISWKALI